MKVGIVGAGVIGATIAFYLCRRGADVTVFECSTAPFSGMSASAFGSLTPYSDPFFKGLVSRIAAQGVDLYKNDILPFLNIKMSEIEFTDVGLIKLLDQHELTNIEFSSYGKFQFLDNKGYLSIEPHLSNKFPGALLYDEPWFNVKKYFTELYDNMSRRKNVIFMNNTAITRLQVNRGLPVLYTNNGEYNFDYCILAQGLTTQSISNVPKVPLRWIRGDSVIASHREGKQIIGTHVYYNDAFLTPRRDGTVYLGATYVEEDPEFEPSSFQRDKLNLSTVRRLIERNEVVLPLLSDFEIVGVNRGWRPTTGDILPILGPLNTSERVVIANGFVGLGVTMAPAIGRLVCKFITEGEDMPIELSPKRLEL